MLIKLLALYAIMRFRKNWNKPYAKMGRRR